MTEEYLFERMRQAGARCESAYKSMSGTDVAEAELYRFERLFWVALHKGQSVETALAQFDTSWRSYATTNNAKVQAAAKIKRGPSAGLSVISHRWVNPELAETKAIHLRHMSRG